MRIQVLSERLANWQGIQRALYGVPSLLIGRQRGIAVERWLRGREEIQELQKCDVAVASFGCSGRTWLRVMLSFALAKEHNLPEDCILDGDNLKRRCAAIPSVFFTHDNYIEDFKPNDGTKPAFSRVPVIFLARHPADIAVSQYFQWKYRMRHRKKVINGYPLTNEMSLFDFVVNPAAGLPKIINYMNSWASALAAHPHSMMVRYEDLRINTASGLQELLEFIGCRVSNDNIEAAVAQSSIEKMRALEHSGSPLVDSGKVVKDRSTNDSYKARRGKSGGYRSDFNSAELELIENLISSKLAPVFNYSSSLLD